jgi:hypothetical protein
MRIRSIFFLVFLSLPAASRAGAQEPLPAGAPQTGAVAPPQTGVLAPLPPAAPQADAQEPPPPVAPGASGQRSLAPASPRAGAPESFQLRPVDTVAPSAPFGANEAMWRLEVGYRGSFVASAGYDPFSTNDYLPQFSLAATRTLFGGRHVSFAAGVAWDVGSSTATDRGDHASIGVQRLTVPLEERVHFGVWGYAFARAAPGVVAQHTEVDDPSAPASLSKTQWLFATDVSAGYAWMAWPRMREPTQPARLWLQAEGGYGWVVQERLDLGPKLASGDERIASGIDLGTISLSGPFFRVAAAASF